MTEEDLCQASLLKKVRRTWKVNPGTKVISKVKIPKRNKLKQNLRREINDIN